MGPNVKTIEERKRLTQVKREKSEGMRDTAEAEWKERNLPLASTSEQASPRRLLWGNGAVQG